MIAIDAQSSGPLDDYLVQMETEMDGDTFYIMSSTNVLHDYNQVTKEMVDRYFPTSDGDQWGEDAHKNLDKRQGLEVKSFNRLERDEKH